MRLNGWQRIGVLITGAYVAVIVILAAYELFGTRYEKNCFNTIFIERGLPDSVVFLKPEINPATGGPYKPWEYDFCSDKSVPVVEHIRWQKLLVWGLLAPLLAWLIAFSVKQAYVWVKNGF